jgi:hypothetical protein
MNEGLHHGLDSHGIRARVAAPETRYQEIGRYREHRIAG